MLEFTIIPKKDVVSYGIHFMHNMGKILEIEFVNTSDDRIVYKDEGNIAIVDTMKNTSDKLVKFYVTLAVPIKKEQLSITYKDSYYIDQTI